MLHTFAKYLFGCCLALALAMAGGAPLQAEEAVVEKSVYDQIWGLTKLYQNPDNPFLQELSLAGRYHGQYHATDSSMGDEYGYDNRRLRFGLDAKVFKNFALRAQIESDDATQEIYSQFTELYVAWSPSKAFTLTVGKQKPRFTYEWDTSSREMLTFERSLLVNQFRPNYTAGVTAAGKIRNWIYYAGVFSNSAEQSLGVDGGASAILSLGYDLKDCWHLDRAEWRAQYMPSSHSNDDRVLNYFDQGFATSLVLQEGPAGLNAEVLAGGGDTSDAVGFMLMPSYDLTKKLQVVGRYQVAISDEQNGLVPQSRYEKPAGAGRGDRYQALYLGMNYYIYGHKLKLMAGVEYANLHGHGKRGFDGWTYLTGVRAYW